MPHLGILDSWLPVLDELKHRNVQTRIVAAAPHWKRLASSQSQDFLLHQCDSLVGSVFTRKFGEAWRRFDSFGQAASYVRTDMQPLGGRWIEALQRRFPRISAAIDRQTPTARVVLSDVDLLDQTAMQGVLHRSRDSYWFSLPHGIDPRIPALRARTSNANKLNIKVYASSEQEAAHYRNAYGVPESRVETVGVPRHGRQWIQRLRERHPNRTKEGDRFIFLASRPVNKNNFPTFRKMELLRDLRALADRLDCRVVVRVHPAETDVDKSIIETALGKEHEGSRWSYTVLPAMSAAQGAVFAITMFSSVAVDMLAIEVPPVELFDFSGVAHIPSLVPDGKEGLTSIYRHLGLVLGASSFTELESKVATILSDRNAVLKELKAAYHRAYASPDNAIDTIVTDISEALEGRSV